MFIKTVKNKKGVSNYYLVDSVYDQEKKTSKHKIMLKLGSEEDDFLSKLSEEISKIRLKSNIDKSSKRLQIKRTYHLGPILLVKKIFEYLKIGTILNSVIKQNHPKLKFDLTSVIFTMILCRFLKPSSKRNIYEYLLGTLYPGLIKHDIRLHHFYRSLDLLNIYRDEIEIKLLEVREKRLKLPAINIVLYDLTTLRFESTNIGTGTLCRFGYSKEKRNDCTQVILGLLTDTEGLPICHEVFPGNTFEGHTLVSITNKLRYHQPLNQYIFIADRGLFSEDNLKEIESFSAKYIVGAKIHNTKFGEYYRKERLTYIEEGLGFYGTSYNGRKCIIVWSKERAVRAAAIRNEYLAKLRKKIAKKKKKRTTAKDFISNTKHHKFLMGLENSEVTIDEEAVRDDAKWDGFFAIVHNTDKDELTVMGSYKSLWRIEDAFGEIKGFLKARPIYHWTDNHIRGHIMLCYLGYFCEAYLTKVLRDNNIAIRPKSGKSVVPLTVPRVIEESKALKAIPLLIGDTLSWMATDIPHCLEGLFRLLNIKIPLETTTGVTL